MLSLKSSATILNSIFRLYARIKYKAPFFWGSLINCALIILYFLPESLVDGGNMFDNLSFFELLLALTPGCLLICYAISPQSSAGKAGGIIYNFYRWVREVKNKR